VTILKRLQLSIVPVFALLLCATAAWAQTSQGAIAGTVVDAGGAVVPNAVLTAVNDQTGSTYKATSNQVGLYRMPEVQSGVYQLSVSAPGFKTITSTGLMVSVATLTTHDFNLQVGATNETITVTAEAETVESETSDISGVVAPTQIEDLPLALGGMKGARAPEAFTYLLPGTVAYGTGGGSNAIGGGSVTPGYISRISGSQQFASEILLDGADTYRSENGSTFDETAPSVDAIQELKVELSSPSAEFGRTTGGIEMFTTKNGTNRFHGGAYDFFQNNDLNANTWFNNLYRVTQPSNAAGFTTPIDKKNDYGLFLGGPVRVPKLYNGKDHTFFFFSWEQFNQHQSGTNTSYLPDPAWMAGDFSSRLGADTGNINPCDGSHIFNGQIFDPATEKVVTTPTGALTCRTAFAGNMIPSTRFGQAAVNINKLFPAPNLTRTSASSPNYVLKTTGLNVNTMESMRFDQNIGQAHKAYFSYSARENSPAVNLQFPLPLDTNSPQNFTTHFIRFGWDWTINQTMLNHLVLGYNRTNSFNASLEAAHGSTNWDTTLGIAGTPPSTAFPQLGFNGADNISNFGQNTDNDVIDNGYRVHESLDWQHGKNNFMFGGQWYLQLFDPLEKSGASGNFGFSRNETQVTPNNGGITGNSFASFMLGQVDAASLTDARIQFREISHYYNIFVQDDWKVRPGLTLNLGLSYSIDTPFRFKDGDTSNISLTAKNAAAGNLPGALVFAGAGAGRSGNVNETWAERWGKDIAPRVGFSYAPGYLHGKTVLRGFYGIMYAPMTHGDFNVQSVQGFQGTPSFSSNGYDNAFLFDKGFPAYTPPPNLDPTQANFQGPEITLPSYGRPGMVENFSLQMEQQFAHDFIFTLGYVGSRTKHLKSGFSFVNSISPSAFSYGSKLSQPLSSLTNVNLPYTGYPTNQSFSQILRPYPQYYQLNSGAVLENLGAADFDALESTLVRRFHNGLSLMASYTFSKTLTDSESAVPFFAGFVDNGVGAQDPNHLRYDKSVSTQSLPNNFVLNYVYDLPLGQGKKYLSRGKVLNEVVGGWQVGGVQRYESGEPMNWGGATGVPNYDAGIHFNHNASVPIVSDAWKSGHFNVLTDRVFNSHAFLDPNSQRDNLPDPVAARGGAYAFGNFERVSNNVRMKPYLDEDFSLNKRFKVSEGTDLMLQTLFQDAFNRHRFAGVDINPYGGTECGATPSGCSTAFTFGHVLGTDVGPRVIQLELRLEY
jgi:hypothetical protein